MVINLHLHILIASVKMDKPKELPSLEWYACMLVILGGIVILFWSVSALDDLFWAPFNFGVGIATILSVILFYRERKDGVRYGAITIVSNLMLLFVLQIADVVDTISPNRFSLLFNMPFSAEFGILLSVIGSIIIMTYRNG